MSKIQWKIENYNTMEWKHHRTAQKSSFLTKIAEYEM